MKKYLTILAASGAMVASAAAHADAYDDGYCREYTRTIHVGGRPSQGYGTACYQPDGSWRVVDGREAGQVIAPQYISQPAPVIVQQPQVVYYQVREPYYRPVRFHHYGQPVALLNFSFGGRGYDYHRPYSHAYHGHRH